MFSAFILLATPRPSSHPQLTLLQSFSPDPLDHCVYFRRLQAATQRTQAANTYSCQSSPPQPPLSSFTPSYTTTLGFRVIVPLLPTQQNCLITHASFTQCSFRARSGKFRRNASLLQLPTRPNSRVNKKWTTVKRYSQSQRYPCRTQWLNFRYAHEAVKRSRESSVPLEQPLFNPTAIPSVQPAAIS